MLVHLPAEVNERHHKIDRASKAKKRLDFSRIPLDDKKTWDLICSGFTKGIFQLEKQLGKRYSKEIKPRNINELSDVIALIRPGCMEAEFREKPDKPGEFSSITNTYIKVKNGEWEPEYLIEALRPILENTYSVLIYQEQIMEIMSKIGGFNLKDSDSCRRAVGKKKPEEMKIVKEKFLNSATQQGYDEKIASTIFDWIEKFSSYGFNKCVSGDTLLYRPSCHQKGAGTQSVGHLYQLKNSSSYAKLHNQHPLRSKLLREGYGQCLALCKDGRVRPQFIKDIHYNGKQQVYLVKDNLGNEIKCTLNHKFMTPYGMKPIGDIGVGGEIICHVNQYENNKKKYNLHDTTERNNPFSLIDTTGRRNGGFIEGNHAKLMEIQRKYFDVTTCMLCHITPDRLEWHHKDGNRKNNDENNLIKLCVSCHKKEDYKIGRKKKWDKGHPSIISVVTAIDLIGEEETFDVEMNTEEHNWVANGFIVSNSHSVCYALNGYMTAYAKANYPLEFFTAMLANSDGKQDSLEEIQELVFEAKYFGIKVEPPCLRLLNTDFRIKDNKTISFGLSYIKGVGQSSLKSLENLSGARSPTDLLKLAFSKGTKVRSNIVDGLIKSGSCDYLGPRIPLLRAFRILGEMTERERSEIFLHLGDDFNIDGAIAHLMDSKVPNKARKPKLTECIETINKSLGGNYKRMSIAFEKHYLGIPLSGSLVDLYSDEKVNIKCRDFPKLKEGTRGSIGVVIEKVRQIKDKNGNYMCFMSVSDDTYMLDSVVVFSSYYTKLSWIIEEGKPVLITGKKNQGSFLVQSIEHL